MWRLAVAATLAAAAVPAQAQSFSCPFGKDPACLDYGDQVCSSMGMCVDQNAACFDKYQCDHQGFTCKSNLSDCADDYNALLADHEELLRTHNALVDDYNNLLGTAKAAQSDLDDIRECLRYAQDVEDARHCGF